MTIQFKIVSGAKELTEYDVSFNFCVAGDLLVTNKEQFKKVVDDQVNNWIKYIESTIINTNTNNNETEHTNKR